jgi:DNA-binding PadR family transcriptional regulator
MLPKLEEMILLSVLKNGPHITARAMQSALAAATSRPQAFGSIFTTLERLSEKRLVRWKKGPADGRRGGRAPRHYTITARGRAALVPSLRVARVLAVGLESCFDRVENFAMKIVIRSAEGRLSAGADRSRIHDTRP